MNSFLLTVAAFIILVLGALFIAPNYVNWNEYKYIFEDQASQLIGRKVKVEGHVNLKLLPAPYLEFKKVKIQDVVYKKGNLENFQISDKLFADVDGFKLWLSIPPLLRGVVKIKKIELVKPHLYLRFDATGQPNWRGIAAGTLNLPYVPSEVSLDSVDINNGTLSIFQSRQTAPMVFDAINGDLAATTLSGPYRFIGSFYNHGEKRNLNFSTSEQDQLGNMRIKSIIEVPSTTSRYVVDGEVHGFNNIPTLKGVFTGQTPIDLLSTMSQEKDQIQNYNSSSSKRLIDIQSKINANLKRVELKDLSLTVNDTKRPQSINGFAVFDWRNGFNLKTKLKANWLDFDQMLISQEKGVDTEKLSSGGSGETVQQAVGLLRSVLNNMGAYVSRASVSTEISEAKLGGANLNNFEFSIEKDLEKFRIAKLSVKLPGRNHLKLRGQLRAEENDISFQGPLSIRGISLGALSHWALFNETGKTPFQNNPYFLKGDIRYSPGHFEVGKLRGDLNGAAVSGRFKYDFAKRKEFILELDSDNVDLRDVLEKNTTLGSLITSSVSSEDDSDSEKKSNSSDIKNHFVKELEGLEGRINLRVGNIAIPDFTGRDVVINGRLKDGNFSLKSFRMAADGGVTIKGQGLIKELNDEPEGNLRFSVEAETANGLKKLAKQLEFGTDFVENERLLSALSPVRLAITLNMYSGGLPSTDISIAGAVSNSQLSINVRHEGILGTIGTKQLDLSGSLTNSKANVLINQLIRAKQTSDINESGQGIFSIQATGVPESGMDARARLDAGSTQARFNGNMKIISGESLGQGSLTIKSSNAAAGLSLIGLSQNLEFIDKPMTISARMSKSKQQLQVSKLKGTIGEMTLSGSGRFDFTKTPMKMDINARINEGSFEGILSHIVPSILPSDLNTLAKVTGAKLEKPWSNQPFDRDSFKNLDGKISVKFGRLKIADQMELNNGILHARFKDDGLEFNRFSGQLYNGQFSATAKLYPNKGPFKLEAAVSLQNADLAEMIKSKQGSALARGVATASFSFNGEGLSPLGLVSVLKGKGQLRIREGEIFDFSPQALPQIIQTSSGKEKDQVLKQSFLDLLNGKSFQLKNVRSPILIRDGVIRLKDVSLNSEQTRLQTSTFIELANMKLDSEWSLKMNTRQQASAPGVRVIFAGPLAQLASIRPDVDVSELKQSLVVKKIEQDFDTLNKIQQRDPETIRRLRNSPQSYNNPDQNQQDPKLTSIPDRNIQSFQPRQGNFRENNQSQELPALQDLGTIDQRQSSFSDQGREGNTQNYGSQYEYDRGDDDLNDAAQQAFRENELNPEDNNKKPSLKKQKKEDGSVLDNIFGGIFGD